MKLAIALGTWLSGCVTPVTVDNQVVHELTGACYTIERLEVCREETLTDFGQCRVWFTNSKFGIVYAHEKGYEIKVGDKACQVQNSKFYKITQTL